MFERVVTEGDDAVACADALVGLIEHERLVVARRFAQVAAWADLHSPGFELPGDPQGPAASAARRREPGCVGGDGTPPVSTAGVVELGMLLETTTFSAQRLLGDVLDLRHRLPEHWEAVLTGRLEGWKAREVARLTRPLGCDQARAVDVQVIDAVIGLPWGRARSVVEGKLIAADPAAHEARLAEEDNKRFVSTRRRSNAAGLRTLVARGTAGDITRLEAMVAHLAEQLAGRGDPDPADTRRAKALAMLANPALTCVFLATQHATHDAAHEASPPAATDTAEQPEPAPEPEPASAVELAAAFGRTLKELGTRAIDRLRPRSVLYLHVSEEAVRGLPGTGVARVDDPVSGGPIGLPQLREWLAHDRVVVKPVLDPTAAEPVDSHEIPAHLREASVLLTPFETFPYGTLSARQADGDHSVPYVPMDKGGPPGQTGLHNLGPLGRRHHLVKTFDGFTVHQVGIGSYFWRTPTGHWYQVDHRGTQPLGRLAEPPAAVQAARRLDATSMSATERAFRDQLLRHLAA